ncbi:hypothetical protein [Pandoraea sp. NPDC087047]|uniref:hypothetical protein n=1 Tax=Pandoraea sp. NPDC087047 TaxID=3364390 RepID=UPI0038073800
MKMKVGDEELCLTPSGDEAKGWQYVYPLKCDDKSKLQNWKLTSSGSNRYSITNEVFGDKRYLRTYGGATSIALDRDMSGYTSMRSWEISVGRNNEIRLWNVYSRDLGQWKTVSVNAQSKAVGLTVPDGKTLDVWHYGIDMPTPQFPVTGTKKVLLMATHFSDETAAGSAQVKKTVMGEDYAPWYEDKSFKNYLTQTSGGKLATQWKFLEEVNIGARPASCDSNTLLNAARKAATERQVDPKDYDYLFVSINQWGACSWAGLASVPGRWVLANGGAAHKFWTWSHEFGHAMGAYHAKILYGCTQENDVTRLDNQCQSYDWGKVPTDPMGGGGASQFPLPYLHFVGWQDDKDVPWIHTAGTYKLDPLWKRGNAAQGYRLRRSDGSVLFLEFRKPSQPFETWWEEDPFVNGLIVYIAKYSNNTITNTLVNMTPNSGTSMSDAPLMKSRAFDDTLSGFRIRLVSENYNSAEIQVEKLPE